MKKIKNKKKELKKISIDYGKLNKIHIKII